MDGKYAHARLVNIISYYICIYNEIKLQVRFHYISVRMASIKIVTTLNAGEDIEKLDSIDIVDGSAQ